ncbi:hypothetical protein H5410_021747, partial [Solanum commersonii]
PVCRSEVVLSTLLKKNGNYVNEEGRILAYKILEHLPEDQEHAVTLGVPLKILANPNDAIGKVYGVVHSGRVRGIDEICRNFGEKLTGYKETKEKLEETKKQLAQNENHLKTLRRFLQAKFGNELPSFNIDSS